MEIVISKEDFLKLSRPAQDEIIGLIKNAGEDKNQDRRFQEETENSVVPYDMDLRMTKEFMSGVMTKTKSFLEVFASNNGIGDVDKLFKATKSKSFRDISGIQSAITKRIRKLDPVLNSKARLIRWNWDANEPKHKGYFDISKTTLSSLKGYFRSAKI